MNERIIRTEEAGQIAAGLRCPCGERIVDGWEWFQMTLTQGQGFKLEPTLRVMRTCGGEDCEATKTLLEADDVPARKRYQLEWLDGEDDEDATPDP